MRLICEDHTFAQPTMSPSPSRTVCSPDPYLRPIKLTVFRPNVKIFCRNSRQRCQIEIPQKMERTVAIMIIRSSIPHRAFEICLETNRRATAINMAHIIPTVMPMINGCRLSPKEGTAARHREPDIRKASMLTSMPFDSQIRRSTHCLALQMYRLLGGGPGGL